MKLRKQSLQIKSREGDEHTSELLGVLNRWQDEPGLKKLARILELAKHAENLQLKRRENSGLISLADLGNSAKLSFLSRDRELDSVLRKLNHLLRRYRYSLELEVKLNAGGLNRLLIPEGPSATGRWEAEAVSWIIDLARSRALSRLRRCRHCKKWLYAARSHQFYCNDSCRKKFASTADDFKSKRREYMADYRANLKERDERKLAVIRGKKR